MFVGLFLFLFRDRTKVVCEALCEINQNTVVKLLNALNFVTATVPLGDNVSAPIHISAIGCVLWVARHVRVKGSVEVDLVLVVAYLIAVTTVDIADVPLDSPSEYSLFTYG